MSRPENRPSRRMIASLESEDFQGLCQRCMKAPVFAVTCDVAGLTRCGIFELTGEVRRTLFVTLSRFFCCHDQIAIQRRN